MDYGAARNSPFRNLLKIFCLLPTVAYAQLLHPGDAKYEEQAVRGVRHRSVQLACGDVVSPMVVFWSFTKLGSLVPRAVAISNGIESKVEKASAALGQVSLRNGTLEVSDLQTAAQGHFMCQAMYEEDGEIKVAYFYIELVVLVPVPKPFLQMTDPTPVEGTVVTMTCAVKEGTPPVGYSWHRHTNREGAVAVAEAASGLLNLTAANRTHTGWYTCTAHNEVNSQTSDRMYLDVIYGPDEPVINVEPFAINQNGFSANEQEEVILTCLAPSNPPSHYIWFYNSSQIYSGQKYVIAKISRTQTGTYTCLAQNTYLNTRTQTTIILTVYYLPKGKPSCTPVPAANFQDIALQCSWPGGFPAARLRWVRSGREADTVASYSNATRIQRGVDIRNGSSYTCLASHPALRGDAVCTTTVCKYPRPAPSVPPRNGNTTAPSIRQPGPVLYPLRAHASLWRWSLQLAGRNKADAVESSSPNKAQFLPAYWKASSRHSGPWVDGTIRLATGSYVGVPVGNPTCSAMATKQNEFLMLSCDWAGGLPRVTLWWRDWRNRVLGGLKPSSNIYVMQANSTLGGKEFACIAAHPLQARATECLVRLDVPKVAAERTEVSLFEGGEVQLACALQGPHLGSEVFWFNNKHQVIRPDAARYRLQQGDAWFNLTIRDTEWMRDSGTYHCAAVNAVGNATVPIRLRVKKYPTPPNVTISKLMYTRQRTEVQLEWVTQGSGNLTGFVVQRQEAKKSSLGPSRSAARAWETVASDIEPDIRDHRVGGLDPAVVYAFRILAVNHRTTGHPSEGKTPAEPPFNAYPAVVGAAGAGMVVAAVASLLAFQYIVRNRDNNPRLHDLLFGMAGPEAHEHISTPEDAETVAGVAEAETGGELGGVSPTFPPAGEASAECHPEPPASTQEAPPAPDLAADDPPVNVTITVTATS
ncbi:V-set and immunoglobulin domain-containing protein 10-like 2 [Dermochelys coriacea]|uniref:V-set and immunoglobulin domain-containing protein 10-like 2 n=1 Tax=Dermochelys coriacea TaxID=27794 RepID=UPI0018E8AE15|nr:V-set and immunoglobulin domain-containing protein 10-like 2 [Dermochelys coriacea]